MSLLSARQQAENEAITRSTDRWFSDGSVVLQAGNTQFRVHWGVLALHSSVFRDMQGLPQPSDEPNVDGCPVVHLQDDPTDVKYLLKALYDPAFLTIKTMPLPAVGAFIRLGRKYEFKDFLNLAVARLTAEFPTTLEAFDALSVELQTITHYSGVFRDVLALASENKISSVLPTAYFCVVDGVTLVNIKVFGKLITTLIIIVRQDDLFEGIERADGTMAILSSTDLHRCITGREKLLMKQFQPGYNLGWALDALNFDGCVDSSECRKAREMFMRRFTDDVCIWALLAPSSLMDMWELCTACNLHATQAIKAGRIKMWVELPQIFGLPPWDELTDEL